MYIHGIHKNFWLFHCQEIHLPSITEFWYDVIAMFRLEKKGICFSVIWLESYAKLESQKIKKREAIRKYMLMIFK